MEPVNKLCCLKGVFTTCAGFVRPSMCSGAFRLQCSFTREDMWGQQLQDHELHLGFPKSLVYVLLGGGDTQHSC